MGLEKGVGHSVCRSLCSIIPCSPNCNDVLRTYLRTIYVRQFVITMCVASVVRATLVPQCVIV